MDLFGPTVSALEGGIEKAAKVQEVIAQNIANANTPGYIPKRFDEVLNKAVEKEGRTSVNLEEEMADLAKNSVEYSSYIKFITGKFATLRSVVTQGRK